MTAVSERVCGRCERKNSERALVCELCGTLLARERASEAPHAVVTAGAPAVPISFPGPTDSHARREPWIFLGVGLLAAPIFGTAPILGFMAWFLSALVHEMGHAAFAWLCGMPAFPAIALD